MVLKRNRKLPARINRCLSTPARGIQTYETTLSNSLGYTDGWASSIWGMGTNLTFHNTGSSVGGDFGELNKLNYDYLIHLWDGKQYPGTFTYLSSSLITGSISCVMHYGVRENFSPPLIGDVPHNGLGFGAWGEDGACNSQKLYLSWSVAEDACNSVGWNHAVYFGGQLVPEGISPQPSPGLYNVYDDPSYRWQIQQIPNSMGEQSNRECYGTQTNLSADGPPISNFNYWVGKQAIFEFKVSGSTFRTPFLPASAYPWKWSGPGGYGSSDGNWACRVGLQPYPYLPWSDPMVDPLLSCYLTASFTSSGCPENMYQAQADFLSACGPVGNFCTMSIEDFRRNDHTMVFSIGIGCVDGSNPYCVLDGKLPAYSYSAWVSSSNPLVSPHSITSASYAYSGSNIMRWCSEGAQSFNGDTMKFRIVRAENPYLTCSIDVSSSFPDLGWGEGERITPNALDYQREILYQHSIDGDCWQTFWKEDINTLYFDSGSYSLPGLVEESVFPGATPYDAIKALNGEYYSVVDVSASLNYKNGVGMTVQTRGITYESASITNFEGNYRGSPPEWSASISYNYPAGFITNDSTPAYTSSGLYKDYALMWDTTKERERLIKAGVPEALDSRTGGGGDPKRYPFYNSYEDYAHEVRVMAKDCSILPEFKISPFVNNGIAESLGSPNKALWTLPGAEITSSVTGSNKLNLNFFKEYSNSDFMADFDLFQTQYDEVQDPRDFGHELGRQSEITMSCRGVLKLLPYEGFYPMNRTTQLATKFMDALRPNLNLYHYDNLHNQFKRVSDEVIAIAPELRAIQEQGIVTPFFAPGILYNSLKSGIAVGWTVATSSCLTDTYYFQNIISSSVTGNISGNIFAGDYLNTVVYNKPSAAGKIGFETIYDFGKMRHGYSGRKANSLDGAFHINHPEALQGYFPHTPTSWSCCDPADIVPLPLCDDPWADPMCSASYLMDCMPNVFCPVTCSDIPLIALNQLYMLSWNGTSPPDMTGYNLAMNNFLGSTVRFFLEAENSPLEPIDNGRLKGVQSANVTDMRARFVPGVTYYMDIVLESKPDFTMCESAFPRTSTDTAGTYSSNFIARDPNNRSHGLLAEPNYPEFQAGPNYLAYHDQAQENLGGNRDGIIRNSRSSFDGRYFGPATRKYKNLFNWASASEGAHFNVSDPAQAPYTPPYYYGKSVCHIEYTPGNEWNETNLQNPLLTFFNNMTMSFSNEGIKNMINENNLNFVASNKDWSSAHEDPFTTSSFAYQMAQNVGDSINLRGMVQKRETIANAFGVVSEVKTVYEPDSTKWVISPKFESPILNFASQLSDTMMVSGGLHPTQSISMSRTWVPDLAEFVNTPGFLDQVPVGLGKGLWSGYGVQEDEDYVTLRFEFPADKPRRQAWKDTQAPDALAGAQSVYSNTDLREIMKLPTAPKRLGQLAEERIISEAVVAIPFITVSDLALTNLASPGTTIQASDNQVAGTETFSGIVQPSLFADTVNPADPKMRVLNQILNEDRPDGERMLLFSIMDEAIDQLSDPQLFQQSTTSIANLIRNMRRFVFPPEMDFIHRDVAPFVMYSFPFEQVLNKLDLQDIWQGILPRIGVMPKLGNETIEHSLESPYEFFHGKRLPKNIRWLVFKVKQRAEMNYSNVTSEQNDDQNPLFGARRNAATTPNIQSPPGPTYHKPNLNEVFSYNWPHDFYSLLELGKVETEIKWRHPPPTPPTEKEQAKDLADQAARLAGNLPQGSTS